MGIEDRKTKHQDELRKKIIETSLEIVIEDGVSGLSMRKVAEKIDYSTMIIYQIFKNKKSMSKYIAFRMIFWWLFYSN